MESKIQSRLTAAAPELFAALIAIKSQLDRGTPSEEDITAMYIIASEAVAKVIDGGDDENTK